ncbi:MAG: DUF2145 domain-containing protein [Proteobacteria bacterium]|nr:DUF2145 domain-containing protein [Pseudomonadota bacterium]
MKRLACRARASAAPAVLAVLAVLAALLFASGPLQAGQACEPNAPTALAVERSMSLAERTAQRLDDSGADVVVLARNGQDLSRWGLRWSHLGLAYRARSGDDDGRGGQPVWRVVHKLNHCGTAEGQLYRQGLAEFFLDDLYDYQAAYAVPRPEVQRHLLALLQDNRRVATLHRAAYSMVAYPWAQTYQQSNQWAIETLALAEEPAADNRERAQAWLRLKGYEPSTLPIGALTRLGARLSRANVAFDDHPGELLAADRIQTVTVDSVFAWLQRSGLAGPIQTLR